MEAGGAFVEFHEGEPGDPERPLLNHLAVKVESAEEHIAEARELGLEIADIVDAPNTYAVFVWGPERVKVEYVEHKPSFSLHLIADRRRRDGRPLRGRARAGARRLADGAREGLPRPGGSMLLSSGVIWRYRSFDEFRAQCPGGDPRLQELVHGRLDEASSGSRRSARRS